MSNKKAKPVDRAMPTIRKPKGTDVAKVALTRSTTTAMQGSSLWANSPELQAANTAWNQAANALESNAKIVADLHAHLAAADASQRELRHAWDAATKHMTGVAAVVCKGSADNVHALGFDVLTRVGTGPLAAPTGLTASQGKKAGQVIITWQRSIARHGSLVQHATDVANPATYSALIPSTRAKYTLDGLAAQSIVHFRVAFIDTAVPGGMSPWSNWVAGTAS
jgi:hypothetical protein